MTWKLRVSANGHPLDIDRRFPVRLRETGKIDHGETLCGCQPQFAVPVKRRIRMPRRALR